MSWSEVARVELRETVGGIELLPDKLLIYLYILELLDS